jgi:hypothetical protein
MKCSNAQHSLIALAAFLLMIPASRSWADSVTVISPDKGQTHAYSHVSKSKFVWLAKEQTLSADITFNNEMYAGGSGEPPRQESFLFKFPGVTFDPATKQFFAQDKAGSKMAVASSSDGSPRGNIKPLAGTRVYICKRHGEVHVVLTATMPAPISENPVFWVQRDGGIEHFASR